MLLKTHIEKMSVFGLAIMLMKPKEIVRRDKPAGSRGWKILTRKE
jgi:hypothetical protein